MTTEPQKLPLPRGWQEHRLFPRGEDELQLDADAYLQEQQQWLLGGLHHEFLCQQMFLHAAHNRLG